MADDPRCECGHLMRLHDQDGDCSIDLCDCDHARAEQTTDEADAESERYVAEGEAARHPREKW